MEELYRFPVIKYEVLDELPDPFRFEDGSRVKTAEDWRRRRKELIRTAAELQYGKLPPEPEFLELEPLCTPGLGRINNYRVLTGTRAHPVSFILRLYLPKEGEKWPVVVTGDLCWAHFHDPHTYNRFRTNGIMVAGFDRTEIVPDERNLPRSSAIHQAYPDGNFSTIAAWAWGYSRVVDALEKLGCADMAHIAFTGLSRGAKTALLAGALDERAWLVNPVAPCAGGSCFRIYEEEQLENGEIRHNETLEDITATFPDWFNPEMQSYRGRVTELPFDEHELKALVAPRLFLDNEATSDIWAGQISSWQTNIAAQEVYRFLGAEDRIRWFWRNGGHGQEAEDIDILLNVMLEGLRGEKPDERLNRLPFDPPAPAFSWHAPAREN